MGCTACTNINCYFSITMFRYPDILAEFTQNGVGEMFRFFAILENIPWAYISE